MFKRGIIFLGVMLLMTVSLCSCSNNESDIENVQELEGNTPCNKIEVDSIAKSAIKETEDGWYYYFIYKEPVGDAEIEKYYDFTAINLKYKEIENCGLPVVDEQTGEVEQFVTPNTVNLIYCGQEYKDEYDAISNFFKEKFILQPITIDDLEELDLEMFDKNMIVELFNEACKDPVKECQKYIYLPKYAMEIEDLYIDGYKWQIGYFNTHGCMKEVHIELIYDNAGKEVYLSDKVKDSTASNDEVKLQQLIDDIENYILTNQSYDLKDYADEKIAGIEVGRLAKLAEVIEEEAAPAEY